MSATTDYWKHRPVMYRVLDETGRLIYVGQTINLPKRVTEHRGQSWWWKPLADRIRVQVFPDAESAKAAEKLAIQEETPVFNRKGYPDWRERPYWSAADHDLHREWTRSWILALDTSEEHRQQLLDAAFPERASRRLWAVS